MGSLVSMLWYRLICLIVAVGCISVNVPDLRAAEAKPAGRALVKDDSIAVFSRMSVHSNVVKSLKVGDVVTVEVELEGTEGAWCGIVEQGQPTISGYVQCKYLEREEVQKKSWKQIGSSEDKRDTEKTRVTIVGNTVLVPATLGYGGNAVEALLVLDTGASHTLISTEVAARLHIHPAEASKVRIQVVGGALVEIALARLGFISVEPHTKKDAVIGIIEDNGPFKYDGLLGMDFLRGLKYHIDFENRVIRWNE